MDRGRRFTSERADDFKKKSGGLHSRAMRAHRRSLEWKQHRDDTVNRTRRIISNELSPLRENDPRSLQPEPPKGKDKKGDKQDLNAHTRQDMLRKWRDEKALKKKLEAREQSKHKPFKVAHVAVEYVAFSKPMMDPGKVPVIGRRSSRNVVQPPMKVTIPKTPEVARKMTAAAAGKRVNDKAPTKAAPTRAGSQRISQPTKAVRGGAGSSATAATRRVTRSSIATHCAPTQVVKAKETTARHKPVSASTKPPGRKAAPVETKPAAAKPPTRVSARTKTSAPKQSSTKSVMAVPAKTVSASKAKPAPIQSKGKKSTKNESKHDKPIKKNNKEDQRDLSFAPAAFKFEPPAHIQSFSLTPLSPSTAQQFLFGNGQISFSPISARRCSTPVQALSKAQTKVKHTPIQAPIKEATSASESDVESLSDHTPVKVITTMKSERRKSRRSMGVVSTSSGEDRVVEQEGKEKAENVNTPKHRSRCSTNNTLIRTPVVEQNEVFQQTESKLTPKLNSSRRSTRKSISLAQDLPTCTSELTEEALESNRQPAEEVPHTSEEDIVSKPNKRRSKRISSVMDKLEHNFITPVPVTAKPSQTKSEGDTPCGEPASFVRPSATMVTVDSGLGRSVFRTPGSILRSNGPRNPRSRTKSLSVSFSAASVSKKTPAGANRCSLLLRHVVSPEEGVEVLKNSPMVELERRTPKTPNSEHKRKSAGGPIALPSFDDLEDLPALGSQVNMEQVLSKVHEACVLDAATSQSVPAIMSPLTAHIPMENEPSSEAILTTEVAPVSELDLTIPPVPQEEEVYDVPYFRCCVKKESAMLDGLCQEWEATNAQLQGVVEEVNAQIRTVVGKAQLLTGRKGRFTQFISLIDDCEFKRGEKEVNTDDLQGFWDMVYFQVEDVYAMFGDLDKLKDKNWIIDKPKPKKIIKKKKPIASSKPATKPGIKARSGFAAFKAKLKQPQTESVAPADSSTPAKSTNTLQGSEETKTFEAGFFSVSSPVRSPAYHCEAGTPSKDLRRSCSKSPSRSNPGSRGASPLVRAVLEKSAKKAASLLLTVADAHLTAVSPSKKRKSLNIPAEVVSPGKRFRGKGDMPLSNIIDSGSSTPSEICVPVPVTPSANTNAVSVFTPDSLEQLPRQPRRSTRRSLATAIGTPDVESSSRGRRHSLRRSVVLSEAIDTNQQANLSFSKYLMPTSTDAGSSAPDDAELSAPSTFTFDSPPTDAVPGCGVPRRLSASERRRVSHRHSTTSTPGMSSAAKWLSTGKNKPCGRSVHFSVLASPVSPSKHTNAPLTPYNSNSLVPRERKISGNKSATTSIPEAEVSKENLLLFTPPAATSVSASYDNRPYTPSDKTMLFTPEMNMSTSQAHVTVDDDLMCFSPIATPRSPTRSARSRRSMRISFL